MFFQSTMTAVIFRIYCISKQLGFNSSSGGWAIYIYIYIYIKREKAERERDREREREKQTDRQAETVRQREGKISTRD